MISESGKNAAPPVNPADLRTVLAAIKDAIALRPSAEARSIDLRSLAPSLSPGADVQAVWARTLILGVLNHIMPGWMERAGMDKVIEVAATFPMKRMEPGVQYSEPPFDVQAFVRQIAAH
jgi:hypothetical protein